MCLFFVNASQQVAQKWGISVKNHIDMLIFHTQICAGASQICLMADEKPPSRISRRRFATSCSEMGISMGKVYGYVRVSTKEQNEDRQMIAMSGVKVPEENIYMDKQSGKDFNRPMYQRLLMKLKQEDLLYVVSIDRLGRDYEEILEQWRVLTREKKVDIVVLDMPLLDTRRGKDLMGTFLSDIVLQVLSFVAENERKNIKQRQREGIEAAKLRGVQFGRPPKPIPENFEQIYGRWVAKEISGKEAAKLCNIATATFYRRANEQSLKYKSH